MPHTKQLSTTPLRLPIGLKAWAKKFAADRECSLNALVIGLLLEAKRSHENAPVSSSMK